MVGEERHSSGSPDRTQSLLSSLLKGATLDQIMHLEPGPDPYPDGVSWDIESIEFTKARDLTSAIKEMGRQMSQALGSGSAILVTVRDNSHHYHYPQVDGYEYRFVFETRTDHSHHSHFMVFNPEARDSKVTEEDWERMTPGQRVQTIRTEKSRGAPTAGPPVQPYLRHGVRRKR